jgi:thiamine transporter
MRGRITVSRAVTSPDLNERSALMSRVRLRILAEAALSVVLAYALRLLAIQFPFGGDISLAMLPLFVLALRRGLRAGILAGVVFGIVDYMIEPYFVHWAQVLLDYPVAYGLVGLAGLMHPLVVRAQRAGNRVGELAAIVAGVAIGGVARFAAHFLSGVIFFASNAPAGQPAWLYSAVYNAGYVFPSMVACAIAAALLVPLLQAAVPVAEVS